MKSKTDLQILALTTAVKKSKNTGKVKAKIRGIKKQVAWNSFLAQ